VTVTGKTSRTCSIYGKTGSLYKVLVGKPEVKRPRRRWQNNIKMYLKELGWEGVEWIQLAQESVR